MSNRFKNLVLVLMLLIGTISVNAQLHYHIAPLVNDCYCYNDSLGSIGFVIEGGIEPYYYYWETPNGSGLTQGQRNQLNLTVGNYYVTITDSIGEQLIDSFIISEPPPLNLDLINIQNTSCLGANEGSIIVNVTGGSTSYPGNYYYEWHGPSNCMANDTVIYLSAGVYSLGVYDQNNCSIKDTFEVLAFDAQIVSANITDANNGVCNGIVDVNVTAGTPQYTYLWENGSTNSSIDNICGGTYPLTVTDATGCEVETSFTVENTFDSSYVFVDTLYITIDSCIFDNNLPIDSASIYDFTEITSDSVVLNWVFWQAGDSILLNTGTHFDSSGTNLVLLEINCNNKSINLLHTNRFYAEFNNGSITQVQNVTEILNFTIYPNPTTGIITVKSKGIDQIDIISLTGKIVKQFKVQSSELNIDLSNQTKGVYFVKLIGESGVSTQKIILE